MLLITWTLDALLATENFTQPFTMQSLHLAAKEKDGKLGPIVLNASACYGVVYQNNKKSFSSYFPG